MRDADILAFFRVLLEDDEFLAKYGEKIAALKRKPSTPKILDSPLSPMPADRGTIPIRSPPGPAPCEAMDTAPPQLYSDDQSGDASSSEEEFQLVEGRKRKAGKAKATMAKKPVAPAPSPSPVPQLTRASPSPRPGSPPTAPTAQAKKQRPPPPIYIQDKGKWTDVSKMCMDRKIHYTNARSCQQGIKVQVPTATDYRDLTRSLRERNVPFHTYALPEDTPTRVVIKRVPKEIATSDVKADLISQDIPVQAVHRLHRARGHIEYDMVLVVCDPSPGHHPIFKIRSVCSLTGISIEKPYKPHLVGQCHNCQLYGHAARNCFATPRCVKCLGQHGTVDCPRPKDRNLCEEPPSCVLCGQAGHPANYRGCPKAILLENYAIFRTQAARNLAHELHVAEVTGQLTMEKRTELFLKNSAIAKEFDKLPCHG
ncbi:hypothetical protein PYW07_010207 [Mythimna separata]|uniref:Pre-C2HC domain-containing protein n=1 Tax=Mythimna separata TaxID=271217 RepID=A0AAD7YH35_MYTSE|nr:hypothetical protein PYW07_010207 [Mythimna separata]